MIRPARAPAICCECEKSWCVACVWRMVLLYVFEFLHVVPDWRFQRICQATLRVEGFSPVARNMLFDSHVLRRRTVYCE